MAINAKYRQSETKDFSTPVIFTSNYALSCYAKDNLIDLKALESRYYLRSYFKKKKLHNRAAHFNRTLSLFRPLPKSAHGAYNIRFSPLSVLDAGNST